MSTLPGKNLEFKPRAAQQRIRGPRNRFSLRQLNSAPLYSSVPTITIITLLTVTLICYLVFIRGNGYLAVKLRDQLFTKKVESLTPFYEFTPSLFQLEGQLVSTALESPIVKKWRTELETALDCNNCLTELSSLPTTEKVHAITSLLVPKIGEHPKNSQDRLCGLRGGLQKKITGIRLGHGCCSDYSEVFLALATLTGLHAREVRTEVHSLIEFYDREKGKWLMWDPGLGLTFINDNSEQLSLLEVCQSRRQFIMPHVSFGPSSPMLVTSINNSVFIENYGPNFRCENIGFVENSDVFSENIFLEKIQILPKSVSHMFGYLLGILPFTLEAPVA